MMKKTWSLLLATAMVAGMLTGCGGQKSNGGSEAAATEPAAVEEPTTDENTSYKKEIRIGTLADLTVKNRYAGTATVTTQTCNSTFNGLVSMGTDGEATPELATSGPATMIPASGPSSCVRELNFMMEAILRQTM